MGDKILTLEQHNKTLKSMVENKDDDPYSEENYYQKTKAKAGQFYYKRWSFLADLFNALLQI